MFVAFFRHRCLKIDIVALLILIYLGKTNIHGQINWSFYSPISALFWFVSHGILFVTFCSFYYGSHYSSMGIVLSYLLRLEPFTSLHRNLQVLLWTISLSIYVSSWLNYLLCITLMWLLWPLNLFFFRKSLSQLTTPSFMCILNCPTTLIFIFNKSNLTFMNI